MRHTFTITIIKEGRWFVARCAELGVVSQGKTIQEAQENLKEAVELYLEDQPKLRRRLPKQTAWIKTFELEYA
jgi:predicted RNase H-like HicB family nuclease